jgi:two-component system sensor histidine kinase PilS (NtrC family)
LGSSFPDLFSTTIVVYMGFVVSSGLLLYWHTHPADQQVQFSLVTDILAITLLTHASGGISSGLGLLIAISIANGSLLMGGRLALLYAALASLAVLTEQVYAQLNNLFSDTAYTQGGLLGITFFAVALLAHGLSHRVKETERLARQRSLDLANMAQLNEFVIQHMHTGVLVVDRDGKIRLINETARELLGIAKDEAGQPLSNATPELALLVSNWHRNPHTPQTAFRPQRGGADLKPQLTLLGTDASSGTLIFLEDTAQVSEQAQQMKLASLGRLTASIAHEIRNPLGAISHAGQLLAESPQLSRGDQRLTEIIKDNSIRVNDVIETVLQLSRRERARPEFLWLSSWTEQFVDNFCRSRMVDPGLFKVEIGIIDFQIQADPRQLSQVVSNLCDNALKFSSVQGISPHIRLEGGLELGRSRPFLDVIDNGPGIPVENARQIFEPFFTTGAKGTGLGLYIAKELCEINKIDLKYVPAVSTGSCFRLGFRLWKYYE